MLPSTISQRCMSRTQSMSSRSNEYASCAVRRSRISTGTYASRPSFSFCSASSSPPAALSMAARASSRVIRSLMGRRSVALLSASSSARTGAGAPGKLGIERQNITSKAGRASLDITPSLVSGLLLVAEMYQTTSWLLRQSHRRGQVGGAYYSGLFAEAAGEQGQLRERRGEGSGLHGLADQALEAAQRVGHAAREHDGVEVQRVVDH